jgi:hypothetical protein
MILVDQRSMYEVSDDVLVEAITYDNLHNALAVICNLGIEWPPRWHGDLVVERTDDFHEFKRTVRNFLMERNYDTGNFETC